MGLKVESFLKKKKKLKSLESCFLFVKKLNFLEIKIDRIFYHDDFSSRLVADLKSSLTDEAWLAETHVSKTKQMCLRLFASGVR